MDNMFKNFPLHFSPYKYFHFDTRVNDIINNAQEHNSIVLLESEQQTVIKYWKLMAQLEFEQMGNNFKDLVKDKNYTRLIKQVRSTQKLMIAFLLHFTGLNVKGFSNKKIEKAIKEHFNK